jgi:hypothetical protein
MMFGYIFTRKLITCSVMFVFVTSNPETYIVKAWTFFSEAPNLSDKSFEVFS